MLETPDELTDGCRDLQSARTKPRRRRMNPTTSLEGHVALCGLQQHVYVYQRHVERWNPCESDYRLWSTLDQKLDETEDALDLGPCGQVTDVNDGKPRLLQ